MNPAQMHLAPPVAVTMRDGSILTQRLVNEHDAAGIADFYASIPREDSRFYMGPTELSQIRAETDARESTHPFVVTLVLETAEGKIAGFSFFRWDEENSPVSTFGICIRRGYQGIGAGEAQINRIAAIAEHVGPDIMSLTVQKANLRAQKLYLKSGFQIVREQIIGERDGFEAEPEYYMERSVR